MPTSHTRLTIYNLALDIIAEFPLATETEDNVYGRWCRRNFAHTVEMTLRQNVWNFAVEMHALQPDATTPAYRWRYQYGLPPGWLRVLPPTVDGMRNSRPLPYEVKRNKLFMNDAGPRPVECVMNEQDPGQWDPIFAAVIAGRMANGMAHRFTGKNSFVELTKQTVEEAYDAAEQINAFEGSLDQVEEYDIIRARGDWGSFNRGYGRS